MSSTRTNRTAKRRRAPRGTLNPEVIVRAAIDVVATDGLEAMTTRRLADDLGVRPMALYTHFRDKEAILHAVAAEMFDRFELPQQTGSDLEQLRDIMRAYFRLFVEHPALLQLEKAGFGDDINPAEARLTEAVYGCMRRLRFDHHTAVGLVATFMRLILGSAYVYPTRRMWDEEPDHWERVRLRWLTLPADAYPAMHELASHDFPAFTQLQAFEFGLHALLYTVARAAGVEPLADVPLRLGSDDRQV
ncbi:TetR/AcrR family transcriptional regulator [Jiangella ureilytica]|uniref:TetR/AcrR family transcriptional regulator n=1 Tax=Jiangella ureilytica TaxID=2530374 RepID=UPI0013A5CDEF|nr:TetR/AcrR family transcriptional regulator [Jiangella ureilytica]